MKLYLVRHGVSTGNTPGNLIGHTDHALTAAGEAQARAVAERLAPLGPMPVVCSDLPRALATARLIAGAWTPPGAPLDVSLDPRLREIHLGDFEGRSWEEFTADEALMAALQQDPYCTPLPNGESLGQLVDRVMDAIGEIAGDGASSRPAVCVVAHDGPIRAVLNRCLGVPPDKWWTLSTAHGGLSLIEWTEDWANVRFVNDTCHLAGLADVGPGAS